MCFERKPPETWFVFKWSTCRGRSRLLHAPAWNKGGLWRLALGTCSGGRNEMAKTSTVKAGVVLNTGAPCPPTQNLNQLSFQPTDSFMSRNLV